MELWHGFEKEDFVFEGRPAVIVFPKTAHPNRPYAMKTEYWDAFPETEIALLEKGFHLTYVKNTNRWATPDDCHMRARFADFVSKTYNLAPKFVTVGMSCGGAHAVNFAGLYPEKIACLFIDSPVLDFHSCPAYVNFPEKPTAMWDNEFIYAYPGITRKALNTFPHHPMGKIDVLMKHKIPVVMVYAINDLSVPYEENGARFALTYEKSGAPLLVLRRPTEGHHPHGMPTPDPIVDFILEHV